MPAAPDALQDLATSLEPYLGGTDSTAVHVDVADEITQISLKTTPAVDDIGIIEDTADAAEKKSFALGSLFKMLGWITGLAAKVQPTTSDKVVIEDAADSATPKESTVQSLFSALGWVTGLTAKTTPVAADLVAVEDSADALTPKKSTIAQMFAASALISGLTAKATPIGADLVVINDTAASNAARKATINTLPILQAQVSSILLTPAADAAVALLATTAAVQLTVTAGATVVISTDAGCYAGQEIDLFAISVAGGGAYTLALNTGTLTINATSECARVKRNTGNTAWYVVQMTSATIV
jgi:hypothetical protein